MISISPIAWGGAIERRPFAARGFRARDAREFAAKADEMIEAKGGCHCGAVRFLATLPNSPVPALDCNCSICAMTGFRHLIVVHRDFALVSGAEVLTSYRFGTGAAEHLFCSRCGVKSFYQPRSHPGAWSVNAHCLDEPPAVAVERFDGRNWEQAKATLDGDEAAG